MYTFTAEAQMMLLLLSLLLLLRQLGLSRESSIYECPGDTEQETESRKLAFLCLHLSPKAKSEQNMAKKSLPFLRISTMRANNIDELTAEEKSIIYTFLSRSKFNKREMVFILLN